MSLSPKRINAVALLLDQAVRLVGNLGFDRGLHPVQWSALRYFARVSGAAATVNGLASFQGTTAGPASRTVQALVAKGLVDTTADPHDGRRKIVVPTPEGLLRLKDDPVERLVSILSEMQDDQQAAFGAALERMVLALMSDKDPAVMRLGVVGGPRS